MLMHQEFYAFRIADLAIDVWPQVGTDYDGIDFVVAGAVADGDHFLVLLSCRNRNRRSHPVSQPSIYSFFEARVVDGMISIWLVAQILVH